MNVGQPELIAQRPGTSGKFISGIPWYYRQFGYSYALDLPPRPVLWLGQAAPAPAPELSLRPETDIEFLAAIEASAASGTQLGTLRGTGGFALELARRPSGLLASEVLVIEPSSGSSPIGYVAHQRRLANGLVNLRAFELQRGTSWLAPTAAVR